MAALAVAEKTATTKIEKIAETSVVVRPGVSVALFLKQRPVEIPAKPIKIGGDLAVYDLGQLGISQGVVGMEVRVASACRNSFVFTVDKVMDTELMSDLRDAVSPKFSGRIYRQKINVLRVEGGVSYTTPANNNVRLIEVGLDGRFATYEISLVSQSGRFFLGIQRIYQDAFVKSEDGTANCPAFDVKWPQFVAMMKTILADERFELAPVASYKPNRERKWSVTKNGVGVVLWYSLLKGYGAILTAEGVARVHWTQVVDGDIAFLKKGAKVSYDSLAEPEDTTGRGTGFKLEAKTVSTISTK